MSLVSYFHYTIINTDQSKISPTNPRDIKAYSKSNSVLEPLRIYRGHSSVVEDVAWHTDSDNIFASVGDDKMLMLCVHLSLHTRPAIN